jgi:hypothetical protein
MEKAQESYFHGEKAQGSEGHNYPVVLKIIMREE